jgi:hypothetical protein
MATPDLLTGAVAFRAHARASFVVEDRPREFGPRIYVTKRVARGTKWFSVGRTGGAPVLVPRTARPQTLL